MKEQMLAEIETCPAKESGNAWSAGSIEVEEYTGWPDVKSGLDQRGLQDEWERILKSDSVATIFQTPLWCVTWYQCYHDEFEPVVITAKCEGRLVGIAPLAKERSTGRIVFAGESMSDYRDFVCEDGLRDGVIQAFLSRMVAIASNGCVVIGQMQPESPTKNIICRWASARKSCHVIIRTHPCRRFRFGADDRLQELSKKKTIRQAFKFYRQSGTFQFRRIREMAEWHQLKKAFFQQHCLRQAVAGRPISFGDPRKEAFYSRLFESQSPDIHFSALWFLNRPIAFMFCLAYRGILYYGAPSIDPLENKHSPGILHIIEAMTDCQKEGFREVDLTLGSSAFKERLANYSVELPTVYLYGKSHKFLMDSGKKWIANGLKTVVHILTGSADTWYACKETSNRMVMGLLRLRQVPPLRLAKYSISVLYKLVYHSYTGEIFRLTPDGLSNVSPSLSCMEKVEFRHNRIEDFLTLGIPQGRHLTSTLQEAVKRIGQGHQLHTVLLDGRLVHYGWSHRPTEPIYLPETQTLLTLPSGALALYDFYTAEPYRGRQLYPANLFRIASSAFNDGITSIYITCETRNSASRRGIISAGFCRCEIHTSVKFLGLRRHRVEEVSGVGG